MTAILQRFSLLAAWSGLLLLAAPASAQQGYPYGPHMMGWHGGWLGMFFAPLFIILVLAIVIAVAVLLARSLGGPWQRAAPPPPSRTPLDILQERFARGEIDKEEYEERRRVLSE